MAGATAMTLIPERSVTCRKTLISQKKLCAAQPQMPQCAAAEAPASVATVSATGGKIPKKDTAEGSANATTLTVRITMAGTVMWMRTSAPLSG